MARLVRSLTALAVTAATTRGQECPLRDQKVLAMLPRWGRSGEHGLAFRAMHQTLGEGGLHKLYKDHEVRHGIYTYEVVPSRATGGYPDVLTQCLSLDWSSSPVKGFESPYRTGVEKTEFTEWDKYLRFREGERSNSYALWRALKEKHEGPRVVVMIVTSDFHVSDKIEDEFDEDCSKPKKVSKEQLGELKRDTLVILAITRKDIDVTGVAGYVYPVYLDVDAPPERMFDNVRELIKIYKRSRTVRVDVIFETGGNLEDAMKIMKAPWQTPYGEFAKDEKWTLTYTSAFDKQNPTACYHPAGVMGQSRVSWERIVELPKANMEKNTVAHGIGKALYEAGTRLDRPRGPLFVFVVSDYAPVFGKRGSGKKWHVSKDSCADDDRANPTWDDIKAMMDDFDARLIVASKEKKAWLEATGRDGRVRVVNPRNGYNSWLKIAKKRYLKNGGMFLTAMVGGPGAVTLKQAKIFWERKDPNEYGGFLAFAHQSNSDQDRVKMTCYMEYGWRDGSVIERPSAGLKARLDKNPENNPAAFTIVRLASDPANRYSSVFYIPKRKVKFAEEGKENVDWQMKLCSDKVSPTPKQFMKALEDAKVQLQVYTDDPEILESWKVVESRRVRVSKGTPPKSSKMFFLTDVGDGESRSLGFTAEVLTSPNREVGVIGNWEYNGKPSCLVGLTSGTALKTLQRSVSPFYDFGAAATRAMERDPFSGDDRDGHQATGREAALYQALAGTQKGKAEEGTVVVMFVDALPGFTKECVPVKPALLCPDLTKVCLEDVRRAAEHTGVSAVVFVSENGEADEWVKELGGDLFPTSLRSVNANREDCMSVGDRVSEAVCNVKNKNFTPRPCVGAY